MKPSSAIAKGKELEDYICGRLKAHGLDARARRTPGSGSGKLKADIDTDIGWSIEAKNTKNAALPDWWRQSLMQSNSFNRPSVVWHPPNQPMGESVIVCRLEDFLEVLKKGREPILANPDRTTAYTLKSTLVWMKKLLKELET